MALLRLDAADGQLLYVAMMMRPRYLNAVTLESWRPYAGNAASVPSQDSSVASLQCYLIDPLEH